LLCILPQGASRPPRVYRADRVRGRAELSDVRPPRALEHRRRSADGISLGDSATLEEGPELLQLLMRHYGGASFPLGRGIHPMTTVPLGLAIDAAIEAAGGYDLEVTTLRYCRFSMESSTSNRRPLRATGAVSRIGRRHVEVTVQVWEQSRLILKGEVGLVRVRGGRAVPLDDRVVRLPDHGEMGRAVYADDSDVRSATTDVDPL
jgi:hypothetical protein